MLISISKWVDSWTVSWNMANEHVLFLFSHKPKGYYGLEMFFIMNEHQEW